MLQGTSVDIDEVVNVCGSDQHGMKEAPTITIQRRWQRISNTLSGHTVKETVQAMERNAEDCDNNVDCDNSV